MSPFPLPRHSSAYSLVEMLIVVSLLALIAALAAPSLDSNDDVKLDRAANAVAAAIRFARSEAMRSGNANGLTISQVTQRVTAHEYDLTTSPISVVTKLINPLDKQPYEMDFSTDRGTEGVTISNSQDVFNFTGLGRRRSMFFDDQGVPKWLVGSSSTTYLLAEGRVELSYAGNQRTVNVSPVTGRVTIQ